MQHVCEGDQDDDLLKEFMWQLVSREFEIMEAFLCKDSVEVTCFITGYPARKLIQKTKCEESSSKQFLKIAMKLTNI